MSLENNSIGAIRSMMPLSPALENSFMESDSEILSHPGGGLLFTMDEFSAEDLFREDDFYSLGWNTAAGSISDILATGGRPLYFASSVTAPQHWTDADLKELARGMGDVLKKTGAGLIGGDFGRSDTWRVTAAVIGIPGEKTIRRTGAQAGDLIYMTGRAGAGNLEAALNLYSRHPALALAGKPLRNRFIPRAVESALMGRYASACMDSSDGICHTVITLARLNHCGFELSGIPLHHAGLWLSRVLGLPAGLLALAECGEYELVMTIRPDREEAFLAEARRQRLKYTRIGCLTADEGNMNWNCAGRSLSLARMGIRARDFNSPREYLTKLTEWLGE